MSDFKDLKRENQSEDRLEAVYQKVDDTKRTAKKKPTVYSTVLATIKRDKEFFERSDLSENPPVLNATVISFILLSAMTLIIVLLYFFVDKMILVPVFIIYCPLAIPLFLLVFNYDMNRDKEIKLLSVFVSIMVGFVFYTIVLLVNENVLYNITFYPNVEHYVYPVIFTSLLFLLTFIIASSFKASKLSAYFLIAVTIALSYYYFSSVVGLFSNLFVNEKIDQIIGQAVVLPQGHPNSITVIFDDEQHLISSIEQIFENWYIDYLFMPIMFSFWAIIIGSVVSVASERRIQNRSLSRTTYLLLFLVLFLQIIVYISTTIDLLDSTLDLFSFLVSGYVAVTMLNTSLNR